MNKLQETSSDMKDKQTRIFDTLTNLHVNSDTQFDKTDKELLLKDVNNQTFNDIKDEKVREIFINIKKRIDSDA